MHNLLSIVVIILAIISIGFIIKCCISVLRLIRQEGNAHLGDYIKPILLSSTYALVILAFVGVITTGGSNLSREEKDWQHYIQQHHCEFIEATQTEAGLPLSTWRCDNGEHKVNIATHATDNGVLVGRNIDHSRPFFNLVTFLGFLITLLYVTIIVIEQLIKVFRKNNTEHP